MVSYFAQLQAQHQFSALASKVKTGLIVGKGIFGYEPKITYLFGLPRTISSGGIHLDIEMTTVGRALDNSQQKTIDFAIQTGPIGSALEHQVPEQMFNTDPANPTQAISTVKALQLANAQGQQIYKIDQTNIDTVLPKLHLSNDVLQDIQLAVNAGRYVITHTNNVSVPGWSGAGYAIIDPLTGSDAYFISGGENGGFFSDGEAGALSLTLFAGSLFLGPVIAFAVQIIIVAVIIALIVDGYLDIANHDYGSEECSNAAKILAAIYALISVFLAALGKGEGLEELRKFIVEAVLLNFFANGSHGMLKNGCTK